MRAGNDSPQIPPPTGAPAIVVPMGFTNGSSHQPLPTSLHVRPTFYTHRRHAEKGCPLQQLDVSHVASCNAV